MTPQQLAIRQFLSKPAPRTTALAAVWGASPSTPKATSPDGITHTAEDLGPVGGPYTVDSYGRPIAS